MWMLLLSNWRLVLGGLLISGAVFMIWSYFHMAEVNGELKVKLDTAVKANKDLADSTAKTLTEITTVGNKNRERAVTAIKRQKEILNVPASKDGPAAAVFGNLAELR